MRSQDKMAACSKLRVDVLYARQRSAARLCTKKADLLTLVIAAAHAGAALPADSVDLINEDDARRLLLGLQGS